MGDCLGLKGIILLVEEGVNVIIVGELVVIEEMVKIMVVDLGLISVF